jgi:hypothetical protein
MALKDRDYMKRWGRNDPYHNQLDLGPASSKRIVATGVREHRSRRRLGMPWPVQLLGLIVAVVVAVAYVVPHWSVVKSSLQRVDRRLASRSAIVNAPPVFGASSSMHLRWHRGLTTPAIATTLWWVNTPDGKRVRVTVRPGRTPLSVLTQVLATRGWHVLYP